MSKFQVAIAIGAAMIAAGASAQAPEGGRGGNWQRDMTRQQAQQFADSMFQRLDLNHDGVLTRDEAQQAMAQFQGGGGGGRGGPMIDRMFGSAPSVTLAQAEAHALALFDAQDLNRDGIVTTAEREQARAARGDQ